MLLINLKAIEIQHKQGLSTEAEVAQPWEHETYNHRIVVENGTEETKYLYTKKIDLCIGLGKPNELSSSQIPQNLLKN